MVIEGEMGDVDSWDSVKPFVSSRSVSHGPRPNPSPSAPGASAVPVPKVPAKLTSVAGQPIALPARDALLQAALNAPQPSPKPPVRTDRLMGLSEVLREAIHDLRGFNVRINVGFPVEGSPDFTVDLVSRRLESRSSPIRGAELARHDVTIIRSARCALTLTQTEDGMPQLTVNAAINAPVRHSDDDALREPVKSRQDWHLGTLDMPIGDAALSLRVVQRFIQDIVDRFAGGQSFDGLRLRRPVAPAARRSMTPTP